MQPRLVFETQDIPVASKGMEGSVPNLLGRANMQNKAEFHLDEEDEIYEGYGKRSNIYPYRDYLCYTRNCEVCPVKTAVLENDTLRAVFLPELGGRLWQLTHKPTGRELLYTNDVIRPSNLAVRDAWFSGGVEWNPGIIGHSPLTMEPMFTARLHNDQGSPVLRMYEYERIRRIVYQMDFWLDPEDTFLNCRMRVVNQNDQMQPMYWWSNMAVPEYPGGRVVVPASSAFTSDQQKVFKTEIPFVGGRDISLYENIPAQVDYFFNIPDQMPKYIANLDETGGGLLQYSTSRLRGRKLFSWGHNEGSRYWQEFLTDHAGPYTEIQAGLGKTQYGCIPMAPHTAWEWLERYGAAPGTPRAGSFQEESSRMTAYVRDLGSEAEDILRNTKAMAKTAGEVIYRGSGYGALENVCRLRQGDTPLSPHLDFASDDSRQKPWAVLLETGRLPAPGADGLPADCMADDIWYEALKKDTGEDWHVSYHLGMHSLCRGHMRQAVRLFRESIKAEETAFALYGLAAALYLQGEPEQAIAPMGQGILLRPGDLSYVKLGFQLLMQAGGSQELIKLYQRLPSHIAAESRLVLWYVEALSHTGAYEEAYRLLVTGGGLEVDDLREGENKRQELWYFLRRKLQLPWEPAPQVFQEVALDEGRE